MNGTALLAAGATGVAAAGLVRLLMPPTPRLANRVRQYQHSARAALGLPPDLYRNPIDRGVVRGVFGPVLRAAATKVGALVESRSDDVLALSLLQAGRADTTVEEHRVRQVTYGALGGLAFGGVGALLLRTPVATVVFLVIGFVWGASRVRAGLERAIAARTARLRLELPTVAQLLALHVRTGAGPVQAVQRFVGRGRGALADEMRAVVVAVRAGSRESEAFRRAAELTPAPEVARVHLLFANGVERGADLAAALLAVADDLREARREATRRQAIKSRAAMLLPTIGILAPVMLLFIAAPLPSIVFGNR